MDVREQILTNSVKTLDCKKTASAYPIFDENRKLVGMRKRPNICAVPHCKKCAKERHGRLMETYKPYFDAYEKKHIRHIICTVPVVKQEEVEQAIDDFLQKQQKFHESLRKTLKYPFRAIVATECHYQEKSKTYNIHSHYGVFSHVNIRNIKKQWCKVWNDDTLIVKYPNYKGRPVFKTKKYAFMEYATRRRVAQPFTMPLQDYYAYIRDRQLIKRIGFTKEYLAKVTTLRKEQKKLNSLPDGFIEVFAGKFDITIEFPELVRRFKQKYEMNTDFDEDIITFKTHIRRLFDEVIETMRPIAIQETIK